MRAFVVVLLLSGCATAEQTPPAAPETALSGPAAAPAPAAAEPLAPAGETAAIPGGDDVGPDGSIIGSDQAGDDEAEEPELKPEDFEEGFCVDDIYAKYLIARYKSEGPKVRTRAIALEETKDPRAGHGLGGGKHGRHRKGRRESALYEQRLAEFAALSYARDVMNGRMASYFGAIPIVVNDKVDFWVQYFKTGGRKMFLRWLVRGETLKQTVQPILQDGGVPMEFFYLAMIESGLSNSAYSRAKASGTWQFMRSTAQLYGLKVNHWVDERRDPVKSTIAAANFLKDLYADLGDWHLAMAAYNAGPGKVHKAIRQGGSADFWRLSNTPFLANETKQYVPKVLAAVLLASQAKAHGFDVQPDVSDDIPQTEVVVKKPVKLDQLARQLGLPLKTLIRWNPELIHNITPPGKAGYSLRLSSYYANLFPGIERKLAAVAVRDVQMHTVRRGETLSRIARKYNVAVKQILAVNPDLTGGKLKPGHTIAIPVPGLVATSQL